MGALKTGRRNRALLAVFALGISSLASSGAQSIRMAWFPVPPHSFPAADGKGPTGPSIELFERIAARMGCGVEWIGPLPINRLGEYQKTGELGLDGSILHIKTPAVADLLLYPSRPYFVARPSLAVLYDNPIARVRTIEDIEGYRIGFVKTLSSNYPAFIGEHRDRLRIDELSGEGWVGRNLQKLLSGRLDAVYERNHYTLPYQARLDGIEDRIKVLDLPVDPIPHYFAFHRSSPRAAELLERYEEAVAGLAFDYDAMVQAEIAALSARRGSPGSP